jgi:PHD/YefM family antitoxin component YafN of YafNO toxin-antitoxin module
MDDEKRISEARVTYETLVSDLSKPVIIEREGRPFGVFVAYEEYERLKAAAAENTQRREQAWQRLDALLADVHARPASLSTEEIESEITKAAQEVREERRARRSRR